MKWNIFCGFTLVILLIVVGSCSAQLQSAATPFQVSVHLYDNASGANGVVACNGAIIHESYVLTTAHCMHLHVLSANISRVLIPAMVYVVAGNSKNTTENTRHVSAIIVHDQYNRVTLENDIALLKIEPPFPLRNSTDIQWIEIENKNTVRRDNCFVSFRNESTNGYPFRKPQHAYIMDSWFCNKNATTTRPGELCSHYNMDDALTCRAPQAQFQLSSDRGTPIVCNNLVSGILSHIIPPTNITTNTTASCFSTLKTWAVYTKVALHADWIYSKISSLSPVPVHTATSSLTTIPPFHNPSQHTPGNNTLPPKKNTAAGHYAPVLAFFLAVSAIGVIGAVF